MKFIDEAVIDIRSGNGGRGCVSFRRERFIPRGGPDGGDGGRGGHVIFKVSGRKRTLSHFRHKKHFFARNGAPGMGKQKTGENGADMLIEVPPGVVITDAGTQSPIRDMTEPGESFIAAFGGRGGRGNRRFKTSTHRAPRFAQPGEPGQAMSLKLELKLLADAGLIGLPNAGKSTLIGAMSSARPKTGAYPFTTLFPHLGVVHTEWGEPFVAADMPGLIKGASQGTGLGFKFLRHIERTRILLHLIDASEIDPDSPLEAYRTIRKELAGHSANLAGKKEIVVLNKMDLPGAREKAGLFQSAFQGDFFRISALAGDGVKRLISETAGRLDALNERD
ncbi:GTPase involved in cell partioning and DNA repair [Candidatus Desulfarcum epimagneticum]|uniref:GTPase Obg n=1 Tax=uncultured Desulfobacteraceae bacterium TaxID=218296 RepID=A0A484HLD6_9BACT|nr:GTPase involved in cell partioning and DNA repair [uncultured Desulfobacteraceae bacterium]